ncbi:MAG: helix-turn-helix domain-containing protein, partial [Bacteroidales bacterium]|nr:helix-turn-helix domain-containing protein [Bacteroidales bacterium]
EITYNLFNEGMTVKEICKERGLTAQTIEGHLAHYIKEGKLDVLEFMTQKELDEIVNVAEELETTSLGPIKEILLDDYTWAQIRMAIAHYTKTLEEFKED